MLIRYATNKMRPPPDAIRFDIPEVLWHVLRHFESECVGGCCGRRAFWFDAEAAASLKQKVPSSDLRLARLQIRELIVALDAIAGPVDTLMITDHWNGHRAARWFAGIGRFLDRHCDVA
jgi:hypothetical protein